jgi:uncharacterized membrane protein
MSWRSSVLMFSVVAGNILAVSFICFFLGAWQVLPISLAVITLFGLCMLSGYRSTQVEEVVAISDDTVAVEKHWRRAKERYEFQRGWAQVILEEPPAPVEPMAPLNALSRLFIRSHGRQVEIGAFLDDAERHDLADRLRRLVGPNRSFESFAAR